MMEEWRSIIGFEGYQVSSEGRVRSFRKGRLFPAILSPSRSNPKRRALYTLYRDAKPFYRLGARLVCEAFHGAAPTNRHQAAHGDGDATNDRESNVSWKLPKENCADRVRHGTSQDGDRQYSAKLTNEQAEEIRTKYADFKRLNQQYGKVTYLAAEYGVKPSCIEGVVFGRTYL